MTLNDDNIFWGVNGIRDIGILFKKENLQNFIPNKEMSREEKLNAISRLIIYIGILISCYQGKTHNLIYTIIGLISIYIWYQSQTNYTISKNNNNNIIETCQTNYKGSCKKYLETDFIKPNINNPFMNVLPNSYEKTPNCISQINDSNSNYDEIQDNINNKFTNGLFQDVSDIYGKTGSQRQFYTMPNTSIPNDQEGFADWLYKSTPTCKEGNGFACEHNNPPRLIGHSSQVC